jgi:hypothetical protein
MHVKYYGGSNRMSDMQKYMEMICDAVMESVILNGYAETIVNNKNLGILKFSKTDENTYGRSILESCLPNLQQRKEDDR